MALLKRVGLTPRDRTVLNRLRTSLEAWFKEHGRSFPWRDSTDGYLRLIAEVLLQRTRAETVASMWPEFAAKYPSVNSLADAKEVDIRAAIRSLGLGRKRAANLKKLANWIKEHGLPDPAVHELADLPGIGPYTLGIWRASWQGHRVGAVDANVRRVFSRVLGKSATVRNSMSWCTWLVREGVPGDLLFALIDLGSSPCRPKSPRCGECPCLQFCAFSCGAARQLSSRRSLRVVDIRTPRQPAT